jgi:hypothetical protein
MLYLLISEPLMNLDAKAGPSQLVECDVIISLAASVSLASTHQPFSLICNTLYSFMPLVIVRHRPAVFQIRVGPNIGQGGPSAV